jgi:hypothetical protein
MNPYKLIQNAILNKQPVRLTYWAVAASMLTSQKAGYCK